MSGDVERLERKVNVAHAALMRDYARREYLYARAVFLPEIERFRLGWDETDRRYTIPIRDARGDLVNVRRYRPAGDPKMLNTPGLGSPTRLFPVDVPLPLLSRVIYAGGEWDALAAISAGGFAVCGTNGEASIPARRDLQYLAGAHVVLALDADAAGRAATSRLVDRLAGIGESLEVADLPEGSDLNDWLTAGNTLEQLYATTRRLDLPANASASALVEEAKRRAATGGSRNEAGFWLARQLRDQGIAAADAWAHAMADYTEAVANLKSTPYTEREARESIASAYQRAQRSPQDSEEPRPHTDLGNAERLVARHGEDLRYDTSGSWCFWDGRRWRQDTDGEAMRRAKDTVRAIRDEAHIGDVRPHAVFAFARASEARARLDALLALARSEPGIPVAPGDFDAQPMTLNVANGLLDLTTGNLRPHAREALCRRIVEVPYEPEAQAPQFEKFLADVQPDPEVRAFLQRAVGYSLTGRTDEQKLLLLHGAGSNGKSTFIELLHDLIGDYGEYLPSEALAKQRGRGIPSDIARLAGARFVTVMELDDHSRLNERLVKQLTGGDAISARFLYKDFFDFRPQATIWISTNHRPNIAGTDDGIWRRFLLVAFPVKIEGVDVDPRLRERLAQTEMPGILRWAVDGALAWQQQGLNPPLSVYAATQDFRAEADVLGQFLDECCVLDPAAEVTKANLYGTYQRWCETGGLKADTIVTFGRRLKDRNRGIGDKRTGSRKVHVWTGVRVDPEWVGKRTLRSTTEPPEVPL